MNEKIKKRLLMQGFCSRDIQNEPGIGRLVSWTPLSCATIGATGLSVSFIPYWFAICPCTLTALVGFSFNSGWFFLILGLLTLTGGITNRSFYDRIYNLVVSRFFKSTSIPKHGEPRRFGCAIGGIMYTMSGIGFFIHNPWLAYCPALFMIVFATIAGFTQWCFASYLYALFFKKQTYNE